MNPRCRGIVSLFLDQFRRGVPLSGQSQFNCPEQLILGCACERVLTRNRPGGKAGRVSTRLVAESGTFAKVLSPHSKRMRDTAARAEHGSGDCSRSARSRQMRNGCSLSKGIGKKWLAAGLPLMEGSFGMKCN
jgi:hypothetical protein